MRGVLFTAAAAIVAWVFRYFIAEYGIFDDLPIVRSAVEMVALAVIGVLAVQVVGWVVSDLVLTDLLRVTPTGLGRVLIYVGLSLAAGIPILTYFGINLATLLTTSAVIGAVLGLALQQPLNNLISGLSLSSDRLIQVGATMWYDGVPMEVEALNWRHVIARRPDNVVVAVPNTSLANETLTVMPEDGPTRCEVTLDLPINVAPDRVTAALSDALADVPDLDSGRAITVAPAGTRGEISTMTYRIRAWARRYPDRDRIEGEILRRAWYALERAGIPLPRSEMFRLPRFDEEDLRWRLASLLPDFPADDRDRAANSARLYRFAAGERVVLPTGSQGLAYIIVGGTAEFSQARYLELLEYGRAAAGRLPEHATETLSDPARLRSVASWLAEETGPVAERLIQEAVVDARDCEDLVARIAPYLSDESASEKLRSLLEPIQAGDAGPGYVDRLHVDLVQRAVPVKPITQVPQPQR
ncbi:mechanosensitive ion channel family protein [Arhodomonas sp. SL1]|uniref:mechanosensitive ion channel family protein n=1 Tax=Arhodomonas sp. SL1 TaxID=3425691 RepID=UPI003F884796